MPFDSLRLHIPALPPGTYSISAHVPGVGDASRTVTVAAGETVEVELAVW